ncbi:MAG: sodium:solute symporter family transporter, partial [Vicinamibacteria bacterium]
LMLLVVLGTAAVLLWQFGTPFELMRHATTAAPELGRISNRSVASYLGYFVIWATAIPVIPHIVMRVFTAKDAAGARLSLNLAMLAYCALILAAVFAIVPVGKIEFPDLADADQIFLKVMEAKFPAVVRGLAVAAVLAAVMSTTDALLLACSSSISHDLLGSFLARSASGRTVSAVRVGTAWVIGLLALYWAYSPPALISEFYTAGIGLLSGSLFVPVIAGLWWKKANLLGGVLALVAGASFYVLVHFRVLDVALAPIIVSLAASALAMALAGVFGPPESRKMLESIERLHA